jgi:hypothetical protein
LLLAFGSALLLALALVGAEVIARACSPDYLLQKRGLHVFSATYGWKPRAGASTTLGGARVTLNARGYRGRDVALPRTDGHTRVVVLGDSVAFGLGVSDEETFSSRLDSRSNDIEVANLAVQGYGPDQALLVLQHDGFRCEPDVVILAFCLANDFAEAMLAVSLYDGRTPKPSFHLRDEILVLDDTGLRQSAARRTLQGLSDYSHLFNRMATLTSRSRPESGQHWRERQEQALHDEGKALAVNLALVRRMDALCRERGIRFLVAVFPDRFSYRAKPPLAERFLAALQDDGLSVVDFADRFRHLGLRLRRVALDGQGHLSPLGHAVVSEELEREIKRLAPPAP